MQATTIIWPPKFAPENCPVHVRNELLIDASPEVVWNWLIRATTWPDWYSNASNVVITNQPNDKLVAGSTFTWRTFGVSLKTEIVECVPNERIAWLAKGTGILAYHAWLIVKTDTGCLVITEETQHGWLCRLSALVFPNRMPKFHQLWLEGLARKATPA